MPDMQDAAASPLLPTYARADLAFERGEGAWLEATDGRATSISAPASPSTRSAMPTRIWSRR